MEELKSRFKFTCENSNLVFTAEWLMVQGIEVARPYYVVMWESNGEIMHLAYSTEELSRRVNEGIFKVVTE